MLLSHSICLRACKICVVFMEMKPESNFRKIRKVLSPFHMVRVLPRKFFVLVLLNKVMWSVAEQDRTLRTHIYENHNLDDATEGL